MCRTRTALGLVFLEKFTHSDLYASECFWLQPSEKRSNYLYVKKSFFHPTEQVICLFLYASVSQLQLDKKFKKLFASVYSFEATGKLGFSLKYVELSKGLMLLCGTTDHRTFLFVKILLHQRLIGKYFHWLNFKRLEAILKVKCRNLENLPFIRPIWRNVNFCCAPFTSAAAAESKYYLNREKCQFMQRA